MIIVTHKDAYRRSRTNMAKHLDLHVNNAIVIVHVNENRENNGIGHDQPSFKRPTKNRFTTSSAEQTP
jgi:hypothetical protein